MKLITYYLRYLTTLSITIFLLLVFQPLTAATHILIYPINSQGLINTKAPIDSISTNELTNYTEPFSDSCFVTTGIRVDIDNDSIEELIIFQYCNGYGLGAYLSIYQKIEKEYDKFYESIVHKNLDDGSAYFSLEVVTLDQNENPDLWLSGSSGGSGGGGSFFILQWNNENHKMEVTNTKYTGKWTLTDDIDDDGITEIIIIDYSDGDSHEFCNETLGAAIYHYKDYSLIDVSTKFFEFRDKIIKYLN